MGNAAVWKILEEMTTDFRKKGVVIPTEVMGDLKNAKTIIQVLKAEPCRPENLEKIELYLRNVESYLLSEGRRFGTEYVDEWLERIDRASQKPLDEERGETRFIPGLPKQQKWIRITPTEQWSLEKMQKLVAEMKLKHTAQKDRSLLVYGEDKSIKDFVKKIASKHGSEAEKYRKKVHNR
jgi:hypothetical protein